MIKLSNWDRTSLPGVPVVGLIVVCLGGVRTSLSQKFGHE